MWVVYVCVCVWCAVRLGKAQERRVPVKIVHANMLIFCFEHGADFVNLLS